MGNKVTRRSFIKTSLSGAAAGAALGSSVLKAKAEPGKPSSPEDFRGDLKKSLYYGMIPSDLSVMDKFKLAQKTGYDGIEIPTIEDPAQYDAFNEAARETGVRIHSIMNQRHWRYPLSSPEPAVIKESMEGMEMSLRTAKATGAEVVLLVPGVVTPDIMYKDAYVRSQQHIKELLPMAEELDIVIAIENVWNKFLLSPIEFVRYIEEIDSPYLQAYFDVGNILLYGYPQDWIRTLGKLIIKVHIKGFDGKHLEKPWVNLGDGTVPWLEARRAFSDIGYSGFVNAELAGGDAAYLRDVSIRMDKFFAGGKI